VTDPRLDDPKPLEPWMLELLREDSSDQDPQPRQELARLVALLQNLPDPESPPDLTGRVLAYVAQHRSQPRVLRALFTRPASAFLIAATIAGLFAVTFTPDTIPSALRMTGGDQGVTPTARPRSRPRVVVRPQYVSDVMGMPVASGPRFAASYSAPAEEAFAMRLDHQLNQLMLDPTAFAQRLELIGQRDRFIARLAERAAERGDAAEIALRVRESAHPLAGVLVERLLGAQLVAEVSPRR
jgi:hypothetical protein